MPFPEDGSAVSILSEEFREGLLITVELVPVVHKAIVMAMLACEDDGTAWSADRVGAEALFEKHALGSELIDIRCRIETF